MRKSELREKVLVSSLVFCFRYYQVVDMLLSSRDPSRTVLSYSLHADVVLLFHDFVNPLLLLASFSSLPFNRLSNQFYYRPISSRIVIVLWCCALAVFKNLRTFEYVSKYVWNKFSNIYIYIYSCAYNLLYVNVNVTVRSS